MKVIISAVLIFFMSYPSAMADAKEDVSQLVQEKVNTVMQLLRDKSLDRNTRNDKVVESLIPVIDFSRMAKLSLGKKVWKKLSRDKRKEFSKLFIERVQESLLEKLELYTDEQLKFKNSKWVKKKIYVTVELVSSDSKIDLLFKFYKPKRSNWKAYDLEILGVSIIQTYRKQFHGVLKTGTIDDLLAKMRKTGQFKIEDTK